MDIQQRFKERVDLSIKKTPQNLPFDATIAGYKIWEEQLSIVNTRETTALMANASHALLTSSINISDKFQLLRETHGFLFRLSEVCLEGIQKSTFPLSEEQSAISSQLIETLQSISFIYLDIICSSEFATIDSGADEQAAVFSMPEKTVILLTSLELLSLTQFIKALIYRVPKEPFWNQVNALFLLAETHQLSQSIAPSLDGEHTSTIEDEFKKIHFFNLAQTNRFRQSDIVTIRSILAAQAGGISLSLSAGGAFSFIVDLNSTAPAMHISAAMEAPTQPRFMNNTLLINYLLSKDVLADEKSGVITLSSRQAKLSRKVIQRILPCWQTKVSRQSTRHHQAETIFIYPGFESIIKALLLQKNPNAYDQNQGPSASVNINDLELTPIDDTGRFKENVFQKDNTGITKQLKASAKNAFSSDKIWSKNRAKVPGERGTKITAETQDASLQGLRFIVSPDNKYLIKVTDLVGIQTQNNTIQLAIVRRINSLDDGCVSVGVEMLAPEVKLAQTYQENDKTVLNTVLFLQGIPAIKQADSIISASRINEKDLIVATETGDQKKLFTIDQAIEINQVFSHYNVLNKSIMN
ncbi:MAG: hypothetical protein KBT50_02145 [Cycloclasticus sp.]|nr:hypothetical protein [Cycloclasticus sp.]MBQ0789391.1 hypothetical protein [Cycloclasticus sp.]